MLQLQVGISVIRLILANRSKWEGHDRRSLTNSVWLFWLSSFAPSEYRVPSWKHLLHSMGSFHGPAAQRMMGTRAVLYAAELGGGSHLAARPYSADSTQPHKSFFPYRMRSGQLHLVLEYVVIRPPASGLTPDEIALLCRSNAWPRPDVGVGNAIQEQTVWVVV